MAENLEFPRLTAERLAKLSAEIQAVRLMIAVVLGELASNKSNDTEAAKFLEGRKEYLFGVLDQALAVVNDPDQEYISHIRETIKLTFDSIHVGRNIK
ncbi:hypothetical protein R1A27_22185 [Methylobacterium sp. NMS12]|uniref:hypothetical protein n=1 Tax=Methylobacterium sp. NMS12 TaxID=3079766 RepID=UPI003F8825A9